MSWTVALALMALAMIIVCAAYLVGWWLGAVGDRYEKAEDE